MEKNQIPNQAQNPQQSVNPEPKVQNKSSKKMMVILVFSAVLLAIIATFYFVLNRSSNNAPTEKINSDEFQSVSVTPFPEESELESIDISEDESEFQQLQEAANQL